MTVTFDNELSEHDLEHQADALISEARENRLGNGPTDIRAALHALLQVILSSFDYEAETSSVPAAVARSVAGVIVCIDDNQSAN